VGAFSAISAADPRPHKWAFGVYGGWSRGLGWDFDWHYRSSLSDKTTLRFHVGAIARYEFSRIAGIQADLNFQSGDNAWTFSYWNRPKTSGDDRFFITSVGLQGVFHVHRYKRLRTFLQGGGGFSTGSWGEYGGFSELYYHMTAGAGIKIDLLAKDSSPVLSMGGTLMHLIDPEYGEVRTTDFVRIHLGVEF
jgi:hypothetical protein